jgi:hypothetical protein
MEWLSGPLDNCAARAPCHWCFVRIDRFRNRDAERGRKCPAALHAEYRPAGQALTYWRFGAFLFPFWTQQPPNEFNANVNARVGPA